MGDRLQISAAGDFGDRAPFRQVMGNILDRRVVRGGDHHFEAGKFGFQHRQRCRGAISKGDAARPTVECVAWRLQGGKDPGAFDDLVGDHLPQERRLAGAGRPVDGIESGFDQGGRCRIDRELLHQAHRLMRLARPSPAIEVPRVEDVEQRMAALVRIEVDSRLCGARHQVSPERFRNRPRPYLRHRLLYVFDEEAVQDADVLFGDDAVVIIRRRLAFRRRQCRPDRPCPPIPEPDFDQGYGRFVRRDESCPIAKQFVKPKNFVGHQRPAAVIRGRLIETPLRIHVLKQFRELSSAFAECAEIERGEAEFTAAAERPGKRRDCESLEERVARGVELQAGKTGVAVEVAALGVFVFSRPVAEEPACSRYLRLVEDAEKQGNAGDLLLLRDRGASQRGGVILQCLRMQPEDTPAFALNGAGGKVIGNEELDLVPEIEDGQKPLPISVPRVRLHRLPRRRHRVRLRALCQSRSPEGPSGGASSAWRNRLRMEKRVTRIRSGAARVNGPNDAWLIDPNIGPDFRRVRCVDTEAYGVAPWEASTPRRRRRDFTEISPVAHACCADMSIHMNSQTWPSGSWKLTPYMKP